MLISSQIFYKSRFMLIAKLSWSKICISSRDFTISIMSISLLLTWLTRTIDALNRISIKNAQHSIRINTSQIMKKMRTNERKEFKNKRRHEQREQYERKLILFRMMMMKKNRLERNRHKREKRRRRIAELLNRST